MVTNSKKISSLLLVLVYAFFGSGCGSSTSTLAITEDFSNPLQNDFTVSTGVWNSVLNQAQAGGVAGGSASRPINFGDGSDGIVSLSNGYIFDTDSHPSGFNFISLQITGGTITVVGSNPLIIRSLKDISLTPSISLDGGNGADGFQTTSTTATGLGGGTARAGAGTGGKGGDVAATNAAMNGGPGKLGDGTTDAGTIGTGETNPALPGIFGTAGAGSPGANLDVAAQFVSGAGGGGGGGHRAATDTTHATGAAGGGGGGIMRISAIGSVSIASITARGGNGGRTQATSPSGQCSGNGAAGNGGAVWVQSLSSLTAPTEPVTTAGTSGVSAAPCIQPVASLAGYARADSPSNPSTWTSGSTVFFSTTNAAPSQTYIIQSKSYEMATQNANFTQSPTITQNLNSGTITVQYAGSTDNSSFSAFTGTISTLSNQNYRYLKFKITIQTAAVAGPSPVVTRIQIPFEETNAITNPDITLSAGCATLESKNFKTKTAQNSLKLSFTILFLSLFLIWKFYGFVDVAKRGDKNELPA